MSKIVPFRRPPVAVEARIAELEMRLAALEARLPARPIMLPPSWIAVKEADVGVPAKTVYRWAKAGLIDSIKLDGRRAIDRVSLERHVALVRK